VGGVRAIAINEYGGPEKLTEMDLPTPKIGPDGVLVRVRAAGSTRSTGRSARAISTPVFPSHFPLVPGWDLAGLTAYQALRAVRVSAGATVLV
jgi:NADPH:quinone reductase-like Zn-dependent oxidoreductase